MNVFMRRQLCGAIAAMQIEEAIAILREAFPPVSPVTPLEADEREKSFDMIRIGLGRLKHPNQR